jgi:uncharacterized protein (UPF0332 family)
MEPSEFVTFAGRAVTQGKAGARTAISRAYYGLFHAAQQIVQELTGEASGSGKAHNLVPQFLWSTKHLTASDAARIISSLHGDRIEADYKLSRELPEQLEFAKSKVELALDTLPLLEQFRKDCRADPQLLQSLRDAVARVKSIHKA